MDSSEEKIIVNFGTDSDSDKANALAVASSIEAVATMINEVHKEFKDNHELLVKARPFAPGSLEIPLDIVVLAAVGASLLDKEVISSILKIVKEYFAIKKALKGDVPKIENGRVIIEGNTIHAHNITINLLNPSSCANKLVSKAMEEAGRDKSIKDIKIVKDSDQKEIAHVDRSEFKYYRELESIVDVPEEECMTERTTLIIYGPILDANNSILWKFKRVTDQKIIQANITDESFLSRVASGEKFAAGDMLEADLLIRQKYNKMFGEYEDWKKGTITKVHKHTPRPEQGRFDYAKS